MWKTNDTVATTTEAKRFRQVAMVIAVVVGIVCLFGCALNNNSTGKPANPTEAVANPSEGATPTEAGTPTVTPTPTLAPKTLEEVKEDLKSAKVSIDELMNEDVVYPTVFGAPDESFTNEALKRIAYFESFGILDFKTAKTLMAYLNYCYINSDVVEKADSYLSLLSNDQARLNSIFKAIIDYNVSNPGNQIVISWGIIDQNDRIGRAVINNRQQQMTKLLMDNQSFDNIFMSDKTYNVTIICKDGSTIKLNGPYDDLNVSDKAMEAEIPYACLEYASDNSNYIYPSDKASKRLYGYIGSLFPAFNDPEHANVRRHGFDAYDYYEEDLARNAP